MPTLPFRGIDGFLGTRASIMLDVVFVAMFLVLPLLAYGITAVRKKRYLLHKRLQLALAAVLFVAILAFELDMQFVSGWRDRARPSPYWNDWVFRSLYIHLVFSISTAGLWIYVVIHALLKIPNPPGPSRHSHRHRLLGWIAAVDMALTAITGWVFYYLAFVAR